mgnify:CR=1 FL=1
MDSIVKIEGRSVKRFSAAKPPFLLFPLSSSLFTLFVLDAPERQKSYEEVLPPLPVPWILRPPENGEIPSGLSASSYIV